MEHIYAYICISLMLQPVVFNFGSYKYEVTTIYTIKCQGPRLLVLMLASFPVTVIKHSEKCNSEENEIIFAHSSRLESITVGKTQWQEPDQLLRSPSQLRSRME